MDYYAHKYDIVADIYDSYVNTAYDLDFWLDICGRFDDALELTAGTGRLTIPLAKAGIRITALDISASLLGQLKEKSRESGLRIDIFNQDINTFDLDRKYHLIFIPFQSFHELLEHTSHISCLEQIKKHLSDNGRLYLTTHNTFRLQVNDAGEINAGEFSHPVTKNRIVFSYRRRFTEGSNTGISKQEYKEYDESGNIISNTIFENKYYIFADGEIEILAKTTGFQIEDVYGDYSKNPFTGQSPFKIFVLKKTIG